MKLSISNWYPGSGVGLILSIPDLCHLSYLCITQSLNSQIHFHLLFYGAQWLSGREFDLRPRGRGFEPHRRHLVVVLGQDTFILA